MFLLIGAISLFFTKSGLYVLIALTVLYLAKFYWNVSKYPKGPFPWPLVGNAFQVTPLQLQYDFERMRKKYGDVFTVWFFGTPLVVINREEAIKEALLNKADVFINRTGDFPESVFQTTENGGIIFSSGDNWREQRRTTLHILRDFGVGKNVMEQQVHEQLEHFTEYIRNLEDKDAIDLRLPIQVLVSNLINNLLYGYSYKHGNVDRLMRYADALDSVFKEMFGSIFMVLVQIFPFMINFPYIGYQAAGRHVDKYLWCLEFVKEDCKNALANYSKDEEPNCVAQAYFQQMDTNKALDLENLYNVCADFFMAGMETTSTTLRWFTLYLAKHQDMQKRLRKEISEVIGFGRLPSLKDRPSMPYTNACLAELQRHISVIPFNLQRKTTEDVVIGGQNIPAGTACVPQLYGCLFDDRHFPEPETFNPERFFTENGSLNTDLVSKVIPFSMGKRQCAGESLARTELFLGLTAFVQRFHIYPQDGVEVDFTPIFGSVVSPTKNLLRMVEVNPSDL